MKKCVSCVLLLTMYILENVIADDQKSEVQQVSNKELGIMKKGFISNVKKQIQSRREEEKHMASKTEKEIEINSVNFIKFKEKVGEIFISNSDIADIDMLDDRSLYLSGKSPGTTSLVVMNKEGKILANYQIRVTYQLNEIKNAIAKIFPDVEVELDSVEDNLIIHGKVPSPEAASGIKDIISRFVKTEKIINKLSIETATQVMLKVKVAEVSRKLTKSLGVNWRALSIGNGPDSALLGVSQGTVSSFPEFSATVDDIKTNLLAEEGLLATDLEGGRWVIAAGMNNLSAFIDALATESFAYVLAEPNLVALSGKSATFKSGGEYGYTVKQSGTDSNTTEFKDWGTSISFTPVVLSEDRISINVKAEVSTLKTTTEDKPPELTTKNVETVVELGSGQSLALAGLLQTTKSTATKENPLFSGIPLLSALFRNSTISKDETELVIIVTPYIVKPISKVKLPTDMIPKMVSPIESILERKFHKIVTHKQNTGFSLK